MILQLACVVFRENIKNFNFGITIFGDGTLDRLCDLPLVFGRNGAFPTNLTTTGSVVDSRDYQRSILQSTLPVVAHVLQGLDNRVESLFVEDLVLLLLPFVDMRRVLNIIDAQLNRRLSTIH